MKVNISYPPLESSKGIPLLSQNRQFQWFNNPTFIYPMVPAYAATLLKQEGHNVSWDDGIAEEQTYDEYKKSLISKKPELVIFETKTPVVKSHWKIIDDLKKELEDTSFVLVGDHVTALPEESFENSGVDYILTGGDFDFLAVNLVKWIEGEEDLEPGIWYKEKCKLKSTGKFELKHDLNDLPFIDRDLTKWELYSEKNGNFKVTPGTYTMVARDCWWHKCTFCSWTTTYPNYRMRRFDLLLDEIEYLVDKYKVREVFDDSGSFPPGKWLEDFCKGVVERGLQNKVVLGCNSKFGIVKQEQYDLMKKANFRYLLFGMESSTQETLDRIKKGIKVSDISDGCRMAKKAGLEPHLTIMVGYPWEGKDTAMDTVNLAKEIFNKGWADTLQATIVIPYPGTPLFDYCKENNLLETEDWDRYDMREPVMKTPMKPEEIKEVTQELYKVFFSPQYIIRKFLSIREPSDIKFMLRGVKAVFGHIKDFNK